MPVSRNKTAVYAPRIAPGPHGLYQSPSLTDEFFPLPYMDLDSTFDE